MTDETERPHVLLVDDEQDFLNAVSSGLVRRGFRVAKAVDAIEALRLLQQEAFDLAVLDVKMPGMSGDELFLVIKRRWPDVPAIMLTGHPSIGQAFRASREGVVRYLAKPCDVEELARVARQVLADQRARAVRSSEERDRREIRVLIVDDESELLESLSDALSRRGMHVVTAMTGIEALALLQRRAIDVVLLDMRLPGEDGLELLQQFRQIRPDTEVIIHTGHPSVDTAVEGIQLGAFDYVSKPLDTNALVRRIRAACDHGGERADARTRLKVREILEEKPD